MQRRGRAPHALLQRADQLHSLRRHVVQAGGLAQAEQVLHGAQAQVLDERDEDVAHLTRAVLQLCQTNKHRL